MESHHSNVSSGGKCPFTNPSHRHTAAGALSNSDWWPNQLNLKMLHQNGPQTSPMDASFNYKEAFSNLDLEAVKKDLFDLMTD